jgi:predicted transcriptional regulator
MNITESEVTAEAARILRKGLGMTQKEFWGPLGVQQSVGARYEQGAQKIPRAVRILLVARHISGVSMDTSTAEGVADLARLGAIQSKGAQVKSIAGTVRTDLAKAIKSLNTAADALKSV